MARGAHRYIFHYAFRVINIRLCGSDAVCSFTADRNPASSENGTSFPLVHQHLGVDSPWLGVLSYCPRQRSATQSLEVPCLQRYYRGNGQAGLEVPKRGWMNQGYGKKVA